MVCRESDMKTVRVCGFPKSACWSRCCIFLHTHTQSSMERDYCERVEWFTRYTHLHSHLHMAHTHTYMHTAAPIHTHTHTIIYIYIHTHTCCTHPCICIFTYIHTTHTHIYNLWLTHLINTTIRCTHIYVMTDERKAEGEREQGSRERVREWDIYIPRL